MLVSPSIININRILNKTPIVLQIAADSALHLTLLCNNAVSYNALCYEMLGSFDMRNGMVQWNTTQTTK